MSITTKEKPNIFNTIGRVLAGCSASICGMILTNPLDVVKVCFLLNSHSRGFKLLVVIQSLLNFQFSGSGL